MDPFFSHEAYPILYKPYFIHSGDLLLDAGQATIKLPLL